MSHWHSWRARWYGGMAGTVNSLRTSYKEWGRCGAFLVFPLEESGAASYLFAEGAGQAGFPGPLRRLVARLRLVPRAAALADRPLHLRLFHGHEDLPSGDADGALRRLPVRRPAAL